MMPWKRRYRKRGAVVFHTSWYNSLAAPLGKWERRMSSVSPSRQQCSGASSCVGSEANSRETSSTKPNNAQDACVAVVAVVVMAVVVVVVVVVVSNERKSTSGARATVR
jgi:hypothetical protein